MRVNHCPTCTCGLTHVEWSDRTSSVDLTDPEDIANVIRCCVFDHSYDRVNDGIPYGIPEEIATLVAPVIERNLSAIRSDWKEHTVYPSDEERLRLQKELVAVLTKV